MRPVSAFIMICFMSLAFYMFGLFHGGDYSLMDRKLVEFGMMLGAGIGGAFAIFLDRFMLGDFDSEHHEQVDVDPEENQNDADSDLDRRKPV